MPNYITNDVAMTLLPDIDRMLVIGCSGGGKSTLSAILSERYSLKHIPIDKDVRWLPGWVARSKEEQRKRLRKLVQDDKWIMDGTSPSSFDIRLPRTDLVIWIRVPRRVALIGLASRVIKYIGRTRPDMSKGCKEKLPDYEFLSYIWNFEKESAPKVIDQLELNGPSVPVLVLKSRQDVNKFLEI